MKIEQTAAPCSRTPPPVEANRICSGAIPVLNRRGQARGAVHGEYTSSFITSDTEGERDTLPRHCDLLDSSMQLDETPQFTSSKYQLEGRLGGGGMGVVYAARHLFPANSSRSSPFGLRTLRCQKRWSVSYLKRRCFR